jgi:hypothetical protein
MYLGSEVSKDNNIGIELQKRLIEAKKCYYGLLRTIFVLVKMVTCGEYDTTGNCMNCLENQIL